MGVASFVGNVKEGNVGSAVFDAVGIVADAAAVVTPFVPGGVGAAIKGARALNKVDDVVDFLQVADKVDDLADTARALDKIDSAGDTVKALDKAGDTVSSSRNLSKSRRAAEKDAWAQERALVEQTGKGSRQWTDAEKAELLNNGKISGYEGHHINNVKNHPELARDPNNIDFLDRSEHFDAHQRNWKKETTGPLVERNNY